MAAVGTAAISLILFDLNGVLYRYARDRRIAALAALTGRTPDFVRTAIWDSGFEDAGDAGDMDEAAYLAGFSARLGGTLTEDGWLAAQREAVTPIPESLALLHRLRPGIRAAVLTNNNRLIRRHFAAIYPELASMIGDRAFVSAEFGARKPDPEAYRRCLGRVGAEAAATLFVDDGVANVEGARAAGLRAHHFVSPAGLEAELRALGVLAEPPARH